MLTPTLTFTPAPPLTRQAITHVQGADYYQSAARHARTRRPAYKFTLRLGPLTRTQAQCLTALHAYHQGAAPFYWDGGEYGRLDNYVVVGEGDGAARQFYLPNRYVGADSISVQTLRRASGVTSAWTSGFSLSPVEGILTFANSVNTIPATSDDVMARYGCVYRLNFARDGLRTQEAAAGVYVAEVTLIENVLVG